MLFVGRSPPSIIQNVTEFSPRTANPFGWDRMSFARGNSTLKRWRPASGFSPDLWFQRLLLGCLVCFQFLAPFGGFVRLVGGLVELDEAFEGLGQSNFSLRWDRRLAPLHPFVSGDEQRLRFGVPANLARYSAEKGSIAIDGVSLTVTAVSAATEEQPWFEVGLIPTTLAETGLGTKTTGSRVNLEVDVLAKYTERLLAFRTVNIGGAGTEAGGTVAAAPGGAL